ncbi:uncharacterized protein LOC110720298 [Chenopodium quinoa]|uniref:uncharacterized protein LOC110720298 n=1 Tax=Chenopodium quinoa TaxID=63459 RepID=UPI000B79ABAA|nr:uncharacterized protein LOC110720298 [Chenopodium quinoa]
MTSLPSIPVSMEDTIPNLAPDSLPITCMIWNVQGAGSRNFVTNLKDLVKVNKPNVLALVETHMEGEQAVKIASILGYDGHTRTDAVGFSGGIWIYWRKDVVTVSPIFQHNQHITMEISRVGAIPWYFTAVYARDFNDTRFPSERNKSCSETNRRSTLFNAWVENMDLLEVEFSGAAHTWARGKTPETRQSGRLDRALCNDQWAMRDTFGNIFKQKQILLARIGGIQKKLATWVDRGLLKLEARLRKELDEILDREEMLWYQKSRITWLQEGDKNTTFFHLSTIVRRWKNKVSALKNKDGLWVQDKCEIQNIIVEFFSNLFTEDGEQNLLDIPQDIFPELSDSD